MKKKVFMEELKEALAGRVSPEVYYDTVQYYEDYFKRQIAEGKSEEQITASLGSARLVAKTIIETSGGNGNGQFYEIPEDKKKKTDRGTRESKNYQKGWHINEDENGKASLAFGRLDFGTVIGKLVLLFLLIILVAVVIMVALIGLYFAIPILFILLIAYVISYVTNGKK